LPEARSYPDGLFTCWSAVAKQNVKPREGSVSISERSEVPAVREDIVHSLIELGYPQQDVFAVRLSANEAIINAIEHGNKCDRKKKVTIAYWMNGERAEITVTDEGIGFDPSVIPDCTADENLCRTCGRGIALMRGFMDAVEFGQKGNSVKLLKLNSSRHPGPSDQAERVFG
jgi:serine/threonine-protein kinase RsbW